MGNSFDEENVELDELWGTLDIPRPKPLRQVSRIEQTLESLRAMECDTVLFIRSI